MWVTVGPDRPAAASLHADLDDSLALIPLLFGIALFPAVGVGMAGFLGETAVLISATGPADTAARQALVSTAENAARHRDSQDRSWASRTGLRVAWTCVGRRLRASTPTLLLAVAGALTHRLVAVGDSCSGHYREDMDGDDALTRTGSTATPAARRRISSEDDALILAVWTLTGGLFMMEFLRRGTDLWGGAPGPVIFGGLIVLVMLVNITRARTRTVRPRHFGRAEGAAALWLGMGAGIATQVLGDDRGSGVPLWSPPRCPRPHCSPAQCGWRRGAGEPGPCNPMTVEMRWNLNGPPGSS